MFGDRDMSVLGFYGLIFSIVVIGIGYFYKLTPKPDGNVIPAVDSYVRKYFPPNLLKTDKIKEGSLSQINYEEFQPDHFLVVDCKETLAQLLTNGFHRDHNCLIMTDEKYPQKAFQYYRKFKEENPDTIKLINAVPDTLKDEVKELKSDEDE